MKSLPTTLCLRNAAADSEANPNLSLQRKQQPCEQ